MTTITGTSTQARSRATDQVSGGFDILVGGPADVGTPRPIAAPDPRTLEELFDAEPSAPRASLATVAAIFLAISLVQIGVLAAAIINYDTPTVRVLLGFVLALPAVLYAFVAAWDHRQLLATGADTAPPWEWALVFPPAYLALRFARVRAARGAVGWAAAQLVVTLAFAVFAVLAVVLAPVEAAVATPVLTADGVTGSYVVQQVQADWADAGATGSASCPDPESQTPGTAISCTAVYEGEPLVFTAVVGDIAAGDAPVTVTRWSDAVAG